MMIPTIKSDATTDDPPDEMNGRGLPVVGNNPVAQAIFKNAWPTSMQVRPPAIIVPKSSLARLAISKPHTSTATKSAMTNSAPTRPSSSPIIEKMKSVSASGKYKNFSRELPKPTPRMPPSENAKNERIIW